MKTQTKQEFTPEVLALSDFLGISPEDISTEPYDYYGLTVFSTPEGDYLVCLNDEANSACDEYVKESVWAFNASFLSSMTGLPEAMFTAVQEQCEGANDAILQVIDQSCGLDDFVDSAVSADGRGHFLSGYDGEEREQGDYFIYRTN